MFNATRANKPASSAASLPATDGPRAGPSPGQIAYGLYAWLQFLLLGLAGIAILLCLHSLEQRRALGGKLARLTLRMAGMRLRVAALDSMPRPCVVVANHSSYLDGVILAAALPPYFAFVIKREMASTPLAGLLLRRIGVEFMERHRQSGTLRDTRRLLRHALGGQALAFFPEGTFSKAVGLLPFHIGAFAAAARAQLPVVPIAIRGTRRCLPPGSLWPRPGPVEVQMLTPLPPPPEGSTIHAATPGASAAGALRARARAALLAALGEPDLGAVAPTAQPERQPGGPPAP